MFARCKLGVLVSVGAATCLATCLPSQDRSWARPLTQSPELGFGHLLCFSQLSCCRHRPLRIAQRFVDFSTDPQSMQQHCQLTSRRNDGAFLSRLAAALGQFQTPSSQIAVSSKRAKYVVCPLHEQRSQVRIALFADVHLRLALP